MNNLADEILLNIFSNLSFNEVYRYRTVSKKWNRILRDKTLTVNYLNPFHKIDFDEKLWTDSVREYCNNNDVIYFEYFLYGWITENKCQELLDIAASSNVKYLLLPDLQKFRYLKINGIENIYFLSCVPTKLLLNNVKSIEIFSYVSKKYIIDLSKLDVNIKNRVAGAEPPVRCYRKTFLDMYFHKYYYKHNLTHISTLSSYTDSIINEEAIFKNAYISDYKFDGLAVSNYKHIPKNISLDELAITARTYNFYWEEYPNIKHIFSKEIHHGWMLTDEYQKMIGENCKFGKKSLYRMNMILARWLKRCGERCSDIDNLLYFNKKKKHIVLIDPFLFDLEPRVTTPIRYLHNMFKKVTCDTDRVGFLLAKYH